ncbi:MAG: carbohydrate kinase family protein [Methanocellales archaeon]
MLKKLDVIAIGAILIDLIGKAERLPEREEEVFLHELIAQPGGSAANTAAACARLGLKTGFIGKIGDDNFGEFLKQDLAREGVDITELKKTREMQTGTCFIVMDRKKERHMYAFSGAANLLSPGDINPEYLNRAGIVHLADLKNISPLIQAAEQAREETRVSLNPGGLIINLGYRKIKPLLKLVDIYISSKNEAAKLYKTEDVEKLAAKLMKEGIAIVALTLGKHGCYIANANQRIRIPSFKVKAVDTTGAGDAFSAGFLYGIARGLSLEECGRYANATAALCVTTPGARFKHGIEEVRELLRKCINTI